MGIIVYYDNTIYSFRSVKVAKELDATKNWEETGKYTLNCTFSDGTEKQLESFDKKIEAVEWLHFIHDKNKS